MKNKDVVWVCHKCGITANYLTCLKRYGRPPKKAAFDISTYHIGKCDICGQIIEVTQSRDFFHPDFELIFEKIKWDHDCSSCAWDANKCDHKHCLICISRNKNS